MDEAQEGRGPAPPPEAHAEHPPPLARGAEVSALRFGVFPRLRSGSGDGVFPRGLPSPGARPLEHTSLAEALTRRWDDDRHFVLYTASAPYRINNAALGRVRAEVQLFGVDVDNHDDAPGWWEAERTKIAALLAAHPGGFVHTTRGGWRALFALPSPFVVASEADKDAFARWYARAAGYLFEAFGIVADEHLTCWNQPIRLPHVVRDGRVYDAQVLAGDPVALGSFVLPAGVPEAPSLRGLAAVLPRWRGVAKRWEPLRADVRVVSSSFDGVPLPPYPDRLAAAETWARHDAPRAVMGQGGRATARSVAATLHVGYALHREDVAKLLVGPYNRRRCSPPWGPDELEDLHGIAHGVAKVPVHPWGFMLASRDRTGLEAARATLDATASAWHLVPLAEVPARIVAAVEQHPRLLLRATYGAGKTHTMAEFIATETTGRVVVVVPRHELARAWVEALADAGETDVAYHASVVQRRDEDGQRHCDNKVALKLYAQGGDVARDVCPSCPRAETCPAYATRPAAKARVHVTPREMLSSLSLTDEDLVVFDDAATDLLTWHRLSVRQLRRLEGADVRLPNAQAALLRVFWRALLAGPRGAEPSARAALEAMSIPIPDGGALRHVAQELTLGQRAPRVTAEVLAAGGDELAETLRDVGRMRDVLRFAGAVAAGAEIHWSPDVLSVHGENDATALLRSHGGRLVVLDAAANVEELRALRSDLHVERLDVADAGDASRKLLFTPNANRTALAKEGPLARLLSAWLEAVLEHLTERRARRPVIVTYKPFEAELRAHPLLRAWCEENPRRKVRVAHYGALRGSNRFAKCDAIVTLGDPWLHGDDVVGRAERLGLDEPAYRVALATAELGQAHGRSRSVRRARRLTHLHVGRLVPDGWGSGTTVEPLGGPPERTRDVTEREEFGEIVALLGGNRKAATRLGCSASAVAGWRAGSRGRALPREALERARALRASYETETASSGEPGGGAGGPPGGMDAPAYRERLSGCVHVEGPGGQHQGELPREAVSTTVAREGANESAKAFEAPLSPPLANLHLLPSTTGTREVGDSDAWGGAFGEVRSSPLSLVKRISPSPAEASSFAEGAARLLEVVEAIEQGAGGGARSPPPPRARSPSASMSEDELGALVAAQAAARRRLGRGS